MTLPLAGVRVLDLSKVLAGPYCTQLLADLGADVVKVERPGVGDETRTWGPPWAAGESAYFLAVNRGKRSVALDLSAPEGRGAALALAARSDVVVENFRAGGAERLGVGEEVVRARNPEVVWCAITGFGDERPGYDLVAQAETGLMHVTGPPGAEPHKVGVAVVDVLAGLHAAVGVLAALRRGTGERVEVSLRDAGLAALVNVAQGSLLTGEEAVRHGNAHPSIVPYQPFAATDGWLVIAAANDGLFARLAAVLGEPAWATDPRFATNPARVEHREELVALVSARVAARPRDALLGELAEGGVPAGAIRGVRDALDAAPDALLRVEHPAAGVLELVASPIRLGRSAAGAPPAPPPLLGEHTREVLGELGMLPPGAGAR